MPSGSPLLLLPDLVMDEVLKNLDMNSLLTLKKVSRGLRVYISRKKLDFEISTLTISVKKDVASLTLHIDGKQYACIEYGRTDENVTLVSSLQKKHSVEMDYLDAVCKDLEIILQHQKSVILKMEVLISGGPEINNFDVFEHQTKKFLADLKSILKYRESPIKVEFFKMEVLNQNQIMQVLPFLDAKTMDTILLNNSRQSVNSLNLNQIANLDQWKNATAFQTERFIVSQAMIDFAHFSYTGTNFETISAGDLLYLKEALIGKPGFEEMRLRCRFILNDKFLVELLGEPVNGLDSRLKVWEFDVPEEKRKLRIKVCPCMSIIISNEEEAL